MQQENDVQLIDSHIQMPKVILKQFVNENKDQYIYDFTCPWVKKGHPVSINTEKGYYSEHTEQYLNRKVETPIGKTIELLNNENVLKQDVVEIAGLDILAKRYFYSLISRSSMMLEAVDKSSFFFQFFTEQDRHDMAVEYSMEISEKQNLFGEHLITLFENRTEVPFVLPLCGHYTYEFDQAPCIILPLTPRHAIAMIHETATGSFMYGDGIINKLFVSKPDTIERMNRKAFIYEKENNTRGIVSSSKQYLNLLVSEMAQTQM